MGVFRERRVRPEVPARPDAGSSPVASSSDAPARSGTGLTAELLFLLTVTVVAAAYTSMAFGMEWRTKGQIGPGFFPRLVGAGIVICSLIAIVRAVRNRNRSRQGPVDSDTDADGNAEHSSGQPTDAVVTAAAVGGMVVFLLFFEMLGALLSAAIFLALMLSAVNRGHHKLNLVVSLALPTVLYLLFEVLLDAGLPPGLVLPL